MTSHRPTDADGLGAGRAARDAAHALLAARRELYVLRGRRALLDALLSTGRATADDVRDAVELPEGVNPVCFGAVAKTLAAQKIIAADGYSPTRRPTAHARPLTVWRLIDRAAASAWLAAHPDRPDEEPPDDLPLWRAAQA